MVHKHDVKGAFVIDDVVNTPFHHWKGILVFEQDLSIIRSELLIYVFLGTESVPYATSKSDWMLTVVDPLETHILNFLVQALLDQLEQKSSISSANIE